VVAQYHFLSEYTFDGDIERVWDQLNDVESWPSWWSWLKRIEVLKEPVSPDAPGAIYRNTVRAPAGYGLTYDTEITSIDRLRRIDLDSRGDLLGRGRFLLGERPDGTIDLSFAWLVGTPKPWMTFLAPIARPAFSWNHDQMMTAFGKGLSKATGAKLRSNRNTTIAPGSAGFQVLPELDR
jgi:hypothetical protein